MTPGKELNGRLLTRTQIPEFQIIDGRGEPGLGDVIKSHDPLPLTKCHPSLKDRIGRVTRCMLHDTVKRSDYLAGIELCFVVSNAIALCVE